MPKACLRFYTALALFLVSAVLGARESHELRLANLYYGEDNYDKASTHFQNLILQSQTVLSGEIFYRYAYSREQTRGLDEGALEIYALARYYLEQEGQSNSRYALSAAAKLEHSPSLEPDDAAVLLEKLRTGIEEDRKARLYSRVDRLYGFFSQFSLFQWKIIASLFMTIPFFIGVLVLWYRGRGIGHHS
ncbi:MAG: hypothetical protein LBL64_00430 [Treponema sp.]|jgi:hypothetical protein|nr:hypothetical protein [Treponema sp.]